MTEFFAPMAQLSPMLGEVRGTSALNGRIRVLWISDPDPILFPFRTTDRDTIVFLLMTTLGKMIESSTMPSTSTPEPSQEFLMAPFSATCDSAARSASGGRRDMMR